MRGILVFLFISITSAGCFAQSTFLRIVSQDSIPFFVKANGTFTEDTLSVDVKFEANKREVRLEVFTNPDSLAIAESRIQPEREHINTYNLMDINGQFVLVFQSSVQFVPPPDTSLNNDVAVTESVTRTLLEEVVVEEEIAPIEYSPDCGRLISGAEFDEIYNAVSDEPFTSSRMKMLSKAFGNSCYSTDQLLKLISLIDYEDRRLELIRKSMDSLWDANNIGRLESLLLLEKNKEEFRQIISEN